MSLAGGECEEKDSSFKPRIKNEARGDGDSQCNEKGLSKKQKNGAIPNYNNPGKAKV